MLQNKFLKGMSLALILMSSSAQAMSLDWSGGYRFEWTEVDRPTLGSPSGRKAYGLNYLYMSPKIIAADGVNIITRFDVLGSNIPAYEGSQLGAIWGLNNSSPAANSQTQGGASVQVSQLYLNMNQEYGSLLVGRVPFEFGLGMTYNAGNGPFDHWQDVRDMVAYKFIVGDWSLTPMLGRVQSSGFSQGGTISTQALQLMYESKESRSTLGVMQESRKGSVGTNDMDPTAFNPGAAVTGGIDMQNTNFVIGRGFDSFGFKLEGGFQTGKTGMSVGAEDVQYNAFGLAAEFYVPRSASGKWDYKFKVGMASGDDPGTTAFEGYAFHRNYDVGMLLFNHRLGGGPDFLTTGPTKSTADGLGVDNSADDETVGNTLYLAPQATYSWNDRLDIRNTLVFAQLLQTQRNSVDSGKDLGLEWDIEVVYKPNEKIQWVNQLGLLFPGSAWKNGTGAGGNLENGFTFGFASKAAISF
ncbi:hypothetical protein D3C87_176720 [compost metagenome]